MPTSSAYVYWRGGRFNSSAIPSLLMAEARSGLPIRVTQGGFNAGGVAASAGTHDGGGVIDISTAWWTPHQINTMPTWLRRCGWAAWYRTPNQGFVYHIHAVRIGDNTASWGAKAQIVSYRNRRNGLANNYYDDGPYVPYVTWENSKYNPKYAPKKPKPVAKMYVPAGSHKGYTTNIGVVEVSKINAARSHKWFSRHVVVLQGWLKQAGYNPGAIDGYWSPNGSTQKALDAFRKANDKALGLNGHHTGKIGLKALKLLKSKAKSKRKVSN